MRKVLHVILIFSLSECLLNSASKLGSIKQVQNNGPRLTGAEVGTQTVQGTPSENWAKMATPDAGLLSLPSVASIPFSIVSHHIQTAVLSHLSLRPPSPCYMNTHNQTFFPPHILRPGDTLESFAPMDNGYSLHCQRRRETSLPPS